MATVKYTEDEGGNKKIILKDSKVSCECCGLCVFYPAIGISQGFFTEIDLPDQIEANLLLADAEGWVLFYRVGTDFETNVRFKGFFLRIHLQRIEGPPWQSGKEGFDYGWIAQYYDDSKNEWVDIVPQEWNYFLYQISNSFWGRSTYAKTYTISGPSYGTVTRIPPNWPSGFNIFEDTCTWRGLDQNGKQLTLRYNSRYTFDLTNPNWTFNGNFKWQVNGFNKIGKQNTPIGQYEGGYSVS
jgi:hypothetical protein